MIVKTRTNGNNGGFDFLRFEKINCGTLMHFGGQPKSIEIESRREPIFGRYWTSISNVRADKPGKPNLNPVLTDEEQRKRDEADAKEKENCFFEPHNIGKTPEPRIYFPSLEIEGYVPVSVPNLYGYSFLGRVNCFTSHEKKHLPLMTQADIRNYILITIENARKLNGLGIKRMFSLINVGKIAGNSQPHPHSQDGALTNGVDSTDFDELQRYKAYKKQVKDPFGEYMDRVRNSPLFGFQNESAMVFAQFAPKYPDELEVMACSNVGNFCELDNRTVDGLTEILSRSISFLNSKRGVDALNVVAHQKPFGDKSNYRLHFHISPRDKNIHGGLEVGFGNYIVDTYPEQTARELRAYHASLS